MRSRILKTKISVTQIALLLVFGWMPVLVVGQNNDDKNKDRPRENKDRPRERPAPKAAPTRPAQPPAQQRQAPPASPNVENQSRKRPERSTPPAVGQQQSNPNDRGGRREGRDPGNQRNAKDAGKQANPNNNAGNSGAQQNRPADHNQSTGNQPNRGEQSKDSRQNRGGDSSNVAGRRGPDNQPRTFRPPSNASTTARNDGGSVHRTPDGKQWETNRNGQVTHFSNGNTDVRLRDNGRVTTVRVTRPDRTRVVVDRSVHGERRVEVVRTDRTRIVSYGARVGFVERPIRTGFVSRTYVATGRPVAYVYRTRIYRGVTFYHYVPPVYYAPVFYGWAWNPWARPVVYSWGWRSDPWYGYYGSYFVPAPVYPTAALWLTDFLIAENLRLAYEQRQDAIAADSYYDDPGSSSYAQSSDVTLSPAVKQAIAEEVRTQLAEMQNSGGQPNTVNNPDDSVAPEALDPKQRIFVVSMNLDVNSGGRDCALTPGDIILRSSDALNGTKVAVTVLNSKTGDCAVNSNTEIEAADLQEMHNQFREKIDTGLAQLASDQGKDGIPSSPAPAPRKVEAGSADADRDAGRLLEQQRKDAEDLEEQARQNALDGR